MSQQHSSRAQAAQHPTAIAIREKLSAALPMQHLEVINESQLHGTPTDDSHFKLVVVSEAFSGQRLLQRHRSINKALASLLAGPVHALALHTYCPEEWAQLHQVPASPACRGGSKNS
ncbi:BolA/IbaG family iron-sulfur metabolism protein [Pseudidiomarina insulisalsae]|uniref:BolA family transcriptional regulator n=1 Tax=Pseudidiomarina insulisalsae TaxID=575789 RepID=A0A432YM17_9GAMM|nr:BolA/IbaG family iron-sulfur metabolism protein [Pseudidiomarina insulisalsae]RUO61885.1 BolA family transcriptional regulator [Pseudidiomarina insulisalsae]